MSRGARERSVLRSQPHQDIGYGVEFVERIGAQSVIGRAAQDVFEQMNQHDMGNLNDELIDALRKNRGQTTVSRFQGWEAGNRGLSYPGTRISGWVSIRESKCRHCSAA